MSKLGNDFVVELRGPSQKHQLTKECHPSLPVVDSHHIDFLYIWFHSRVAEVTPAIHREVLWIYIDWIRNREVHPCPFNDRHDSLENLSEWQMPCNGHHCSLTTLCSGSIFPIHMFSIGVLERCSIKIWIKPTSSEMNQNIQTLIWSYRQSYRQFLTMFCFVFFDKIFLISLTIMKTKEHVTVIKWF